MVGALEAGKNGAGLVDIFKGAASAVILVGWHHATLIVEVSTAMPAAAVAAAAVAAAEAAVAAAVGFVIGVTVVIHHIPREKNENNKLEKDS